ncbi:FadR/GntR family transcriptional regulator [Trujillonella humicola]|uniref:FadR/GntR family transcriptional regulator n=1 Tax=Trujillonella humicola TaxID=3383699 RepID=UPI0039069733
MTAVEPLGADPGSPAPIGQQVRVPKMAELVASQLRRQIVRGELAEGEALPSEAALMAQFHVSRPTLREAFRVLESESLITVRRGARGGARVQLPRPEVAARYAGLILQHRGTTLEDLYVARSLIEPQAVGLLARSRTAEDVARLRAAVEDEPSDDRAQIVRAHERFHTLLIELTGNQTLQVLIGIIEHLTDTADWSRLHPNQTSAEVKRDSRRSLRAHYKVIELIEAGDDDAAEDLWRRHLIATKEYLSHSDVTTVLDLFS